MNSKPRTVSGMRPTGPLHLGHYFGVLKNWVELQHTEEAYFFVADWHALTSDYADPSKVRRNIHEMVKDWVGAGLNPEKCVIFRQSHVKQHAELSLLLSMITPFPGWSATPPTRNSSNRSATKTWAMRASSAIPCSWRRTSLCTDLTACLWAKTSCPTWS